MGRAHVITGLDGTLPTLNSLGEGIGVVVALALVRRAVARGTRCDLDYQLSRQGNLAA